MKKRMLSMVMAASMLVPMTPAVHAQELQFTDMEEETFVQETGNGVSSYVGDGTKESPYQVEINSIDDFKTFKASCKRYKYYNVNLKTDLDLSSLPQPSRWGGFINYFTGTFNGEGHTISGLPTDCYVFENIYDATIQNLTFNLEGKAGFLAGTSKPYKGQYGQYGEDKLQNVNVISTKNGKPVTVQLYGSEQANYAPFLGVAGWKVEMNNCKNYADISGNTYAGVFVGSYILAPTSGQQISKDQYFRFVNCENHGNITYKTAGMFFGNSSQMEGQHVSFDGCKNYGTIRGTDSAHFFTSDIISSTLYEKNDYFKNIEQGLISGQNNSNMTATCTDPKCPNHGSVGSIGVLDKLEDLGVVAVYNAKGNKYYRIEKPNEKYTYKLTAYRYVNTYSDPEFKHSTGTDRVSITEDLLASNQFTSKVFVEAPMHQGSSKDGTLPQNVKLIDERGELYFCSDQGENFGYWIDMSKPSQSGDYFRFGNDNNAKYPPIVYLSVYDEKGSLFATADIKDEVLPPVDQGGSTDPEKPTETPSVILGKEDAETGYVETSTTVEEDDRPFELTALPVKDPTMDLDQYECKVESDNPQVATAEVNPENGNIKVTPVGKGDATITATYTKKDATSSRMNESGFANEADTVSELKATFVIHVVEAQEESKPSGGGGSSAGGGSTTGTQFVKNAVYRAYNPNSSEHFYTPNYDEFKYITSIGWNDEGIACMTETKTNGHTLYRVYNPNSGLHHYTLDENEKNVLVSLGWNDEGVAWYTSKNENDPAVYRLYNLNDSQHHYTMDVKERDALVKLGWTDEGIGYHTSPIKK